MNTQEVNRRAFKVVSLKEKLAILQQIESGSSRREIQKIFNCSQSTICRILVSKESILEEAKNCNGDKRENLTANNYAYKELYAALTKWANEIKQADGVITVQIARKKAEELSRDMGQELSPSKAWLYRWKERENILFAKGHKKPEQYTKNAANVKEGLVIESECKADKGTEPNSENPILPISDNYQATNSEERLQHIKNFPKNLKKHRSKKGFIKKIPGGLVCRSRKEKTFLTLLQKLELLQRLRSGERRSELIKEYNLSQSTISQIVSEEEKILRVAAKGQNLQMKRIRGGIFRDGEAELNNWVLQEMSKGESLTRAQIKKRAKEIAGRLNIDFKASTGWLEKWRARMNMEFNEDQILHRKLPQYLENDTNINSYVEAEDPTVHFESQEIETNYDDDADKSSEELSCEVKSEYLTPQQFYTQTIENDRLAEQQRNNCCKKQIEHLKGIRKEVTELEETDIKPIIESSTSLDLSTAVIETLPDMALCLQDIKKETDEADINNFASKLQVKESLKNQIHYWLNRYHIEPLAAKELLDILKLHLDDVT